MREQEEMGNVSNLGAEIPTEIPLPFPHPDYQRASVSEQERFFLFFSF